MNQHYRRFSLEYFLRCQQRLGITQIELWCGAAHFWLDHEGYGDIRELKKTLAKYGICVVSLVAPSISYQYQFASPQSRHIKYSFCYFENAIHVAVELGASIVVVNSGWGYCGENEDQMWCRSRDQLASLSRCAEREGIILALESLREDESNIVYNLDRTYRMISEIGSPNLKAMIDNIATGAAGESLEDWFTVFGADLVHMHFIDGDPWLHNVWGDGNTSLSEQIAIINKHHYGGYLVQEVADEHYFADPYIADLRNFRALERFVVD